MEGCPCPVPDNAIVAVRFRSRDTAQPPRYALDWDWSHDGGGDDIVEYLQYS